MGLEKEIKKLKAMLIEKEEKLKSLTDKAS